jgi:Ca2+-binding EF-hand superfamily protein
MIAERVRKLSIVLLALVLSSLAARADERRAADPEQLLDEARTQFARADADGDSSLTLVEFLALYPAAEHTDRKRQFAEFDRSADGNLSRGEFAKLVLPTEQRGPIRDPIVELERRALAKWQAIFDAAESGNAVTPDNWPAEQISRQIPALADVTFEQWDRNGDGAVGRDEGRWLMEVAYGLTQLDGRPIRTPQGRVLSWYYFRAVDQDHDGVLSRREFVVNHNGGTDREKNAALFEKYDADADGRLTAEETLILYWHDTLAEFFSYDRDSDGSLSADEFMKIGWATEIAGRSARAFDDDRDGKISYQDFRRTTFANQSSDWGKPRRDLDHDGRLSFPEFYLERPPLLIAQCRYFFDHFDLNKDGFLSSAEFEFDSAFAADDANHDGQLTLDEFLAPVDGSERADRTRRFLVFDFDGNGRLDAKEYDTFTAPVDERGKVPDPMAEFAEAAFAKWQAICAAADRDGDGALSLAEWPAKEIAKVVPAVADNSFFLWDRGGDGRVDQADARWLVDVAYGLVQLDGRPLRTPTGRMFAWYFFRRHDADHNDLLSRNEFVAGYHPARADAGLFDKLDGDGDGQLTQQETWPVFCHDTIAMFLDYDRNHDGYLTADEILSIGWGRYLARRTVPVFDDDGDGKLSFREFRLTNFANQASDWWNLRDLDNDGRISWKEFYQEKPPLLIAQSRFFFDRFDRNQDGFLSALEFSSEADPTHGLLLFFADTLERVLPLELQFARHVCPLTDEQSAALAHDGQSAIERLVEKSGTGTRKTTVAGATSGGGGVASAGAFPAAARVPTGIQLAIVRAPHLLLRRELAEALRSRSEKRDAAGGDSPAVPDVWQKLDAERIQADERRKLAASLQHVAMLDEALLLSGKQRQELCDLLATDASDAWWQDRGRAVVVLDSQVEPIFALFSNSGFVGLFVPEAELAKRLTDRQLVIYKELQQPHEEEVVFAQQALPKPAGAAAAAAPAPAVPVAPRALGNKAGGGQVIQGANALQPRARRRVLRQGPTIEDQERRLTGYLEQRLDEIDAACGLGEAARAKLSLSAKLDLARMREQLSSRPPDKLNDGEEIVVQKVQVGGAVPLPLEVFTGQESHFQKSLQGRLSLDQKTKLVAADGQRRTLQRQALVEAVVAGFERTAALTSAQCDKLAAVLNEALADVDVADAAAWRAECLRRISGIPFERLQPLFFDFQQQAAIQQHGQVIEWARQFEASQRNQARLGIPSASA